MLPHSILPFLFVFCPLVNGLSEELEEEQIKAYKYLKFVDRKYTENYRHLANTSWHFNYDRNPKNARRMADTKIRVMTDNRDIWKEIQTIDWKNLEFTNDIKRQFKKYSVVGTEALSDLKRVKYTKCIADMRKAFVAPKMCSNTNFSDCHLYLPELQTKFEAEKEDKDLKQLWLEYRRVIGPHYLQVVYRNFVELGNEAAKLNGFSDLGEMWLNQYEVFDMPDLIQELWEEVKPLYVQLHAYIKHKLKQEHGRDALPEKGPIPVHLIGDIQGRSFKNLWNISVPFPNKGHQDFTEELLKREYIRPVHFFQTAENFYKSLGLPGMPASFWNYSIFEKPEGTNANCKAYSVDFHDGEDYRVYQCTEINQDDFLSAHRLMAEVQYFMHYKDQPVIFKRPPIDDWSRVISATSMQNYNAWYKSARCFPLTSGLYLFQAFRLAIGEAMVLTASSEKYLSELGLVPPEGFDNETEINFLFKMALTKVASLPYDYIADLWRWDVFMRKVTFFDYNCNWWQLRNNVQGVEPPINRTDKDFDLSANYDLITNIPFIQNFISNIIQFQFHSSLCNIAGEFDENDPERPLHKCSIYKSTEAGEYITKMLQLGASRPWPDAMQALTRFQRKMNGSGMLNYFKPLMKWLEKENEKNHIYVGWEKSEKVCGKAREEGEFSQPVIRPVREDL